MNIDALKQCVSLNGTGVLLLDSSFQGLDILCQIFTGFGITSVERYTRAPEAGEALDRRLFGLIVVEASTVSDSGSGYDFVAGVRRGTGTNAMTPIVMTAGHTPMRDVLKARDSGANIVIAKPLKPQIVLDRMSWLAAEKRDFVDTGSYRGPDRRWHSTGAPQGTNGRRTSDLSGEIGEAWAPNLLQEDIDTFFRPHRIDIC